VTDDEIRAALVELKRKATNVEPLTMSAGDHVELIELIIDAEALLRGFAPQRPREKIERDIAAIIK